MGRIDRDYPEAKAKLTYATGYLPFIGAYTSRLYSNSLSRDLYSYQKAGYERQYADWMKNVGSQGKTIQYPELSYPGHIRALDTASSQSVFDSLGATSRFTGTTLASAYAGARAYRRGRSLYGQLGGYSSRYL